MEKYHQLNSVCYVSSYNKLSSLHLKDFLKILTEGTQSLDLIFALKVRGGAKGERSDEDYPQMIYLPT